jgi:hypothetical protein
VSGTLYCRRCFAAPVRNVTSCDGLPHDFVVSGDALRSAERMIQAGTLDACADMIANRVEAGEAPPLGYLVGLFRGIAERKRAT